MQGMELKFGEAPKRRWYIVAEHLCVSYFPFKTEWKSLSLKFKCNYKLPLRSSTFDNQTEIRPILRTTHISRNFIVTLSFIKAVVAVTVT